MLSFEMNDRKKIGVGLTGFGVFFTFLGVIFFFDKGLLAMGNILFLSGLALTIGIKSTTSFFLKRSNYKGSISFLVGFLLVVLGWAFLGMILEAYGFIVLFREVYELGKLKVVGTTDILSKLCKVFNQDSQWLHAHSVLLPVKNPYYWLVLPAAFLYKIFGTLSPKEGTCMTYFQLSARRRKKRLPLFSSLCKLVMKVLMVCRARNIFGRIQQGKAILKGIPSVR